MYSESLLVHFRRAQCLQQQAVAYPSVNLNTRQLGDLELLLNRALYPLTGFMTQKDYKSVLNDMRLADGSLWPMPICLDIEQELAGQLQPGDKLALRDKEGFMLAVLDVQDIWQPDKLQEARLVYGTDDAKSHPGVDNFLRSTKDWYVGGNLEGLHLPPHFDFVGLRQGPTEVARRFSQMGWRKVLGFQTSDYLHCAHKAMILHAAREAGASILLHPAIGKTLPGNLDHYTLVRCYQQFVQKFPKNMIHLSLLPLVSRQAGPREALWQAMVRRNFGCTHFMVAADHADPFSSFKNTFYPQGAAQKLVAEYAAETEIEMVPLQDMVYVQDRAEYVLSSQISSDMDVREISSQELQRRLEHGLDIPEWFSFPEIVQELRKAHPPRHKQGITLFLTGLSGAGKSTVAKVLLSRFLEMRDRPVTLLDGDIVRRNLSSELNFSREHRELNVRRIGFVASEITKNGGIAICAPIAPYEEARRHNRELISRYGGYIEIFISTPLETCEQRDRKGLYAKAKAGLIKGVTGIDDPYIPPQNPELSIDTSEMTPAEAAQVVMLYLEEQGYVR